MEETKNGYRKSSPFSKENKSADWNSDILGENISSNSIAMLKDLKIEGNESTILERVKGNKTGDEIKIIEENYKSDYNHIDSGQRQKV